MYQNVSQLTFINKFTTMGRKSQFSYEALEALFDWYEELEESTGKQIELDVIAICCDWTEYDSHKELIEAYEHLPSLEDIKDHHTVIELDNGHYLVME